MMKSDVKNTLKVYTKILKHIFKNLRNLVLSKDLICFEKKRIILFGEKLGKL